jgi:hypothetical protein
MPLVALEGLLGLFRQGDIIEPQVERMGMDRHTGSLTERWDKKFPGFPSKYFPYTSFRGQHYRGRRDAYLKSIIIKMLADHNSTNTIIVNPACVFGRHACDLASRLPLVRVIGTDIDPGWDRIYRFVKRSRIPDNYSFIKDDIFTPHLKVPASAVVFFGACGAVTDGALDYAITTRTRYIMCRTCCHDNIGGNVSVIKRFNSVNRFFRFKNWAFARMKRRAKYAGHYFSDKYPRDAYPRSETARRVSSPDEFREVARHSADSDICRAIIDLDRYLYLVEKGYTVMYQGELFVAEQKT